MSGSVSCNIAEELAAEPAQSLESVTSCSWFVRDARTMTLSSDPGFLYSRRAHGAPNMDFVISTNSEVGFVVAGVSDTRRAHRMVSGTASRDSYVDLILVPNAL